MPSQERSAMIARLAQMILMRAFDHPTRIAVDGRTASGKTTFADELAEALETSGREVIRTSIDGFHRPKVERYARGRHSAEGYYFDARDLQAVRTLLLDPLGPGGDRRYRTASFDLEQDVPIEQPALSATRNALLIVDGTFLQRPELIDGWDLKLFLDKSEVLSELRGIGRDATKLGGEEATRLLYAQRYKPAFALYEQLCQPRLSADIVVENDDLDRPRLHLRSAIA